SSLTGLVHDGELKTLAASPLPHSLGILYEELTEHLGFLRSSDEYKVMALASYGSPTHLDTLRDLVRFDGGGAFDVKIPDWNRLRAEDESTANLASSVQTRLEEVLMEAAVWLHRETGETRLAMAGGVALNCVANSRIFREGPFEEIFVQPAAGDAGTSLGAAYLLAHRSGDELSPITTAALGRSYDDEEIRAVLEEVRVPYEQPS